MLLGLRQLNNKDLPSNLILRLIMLTDGLPNQGVAQHRESLLPLLEKVIGKATMSAFGYGADANQELLADLAAKGKGNYAFIENPDDALSAFAKELGGLLSTYAQNIEMDIKANNGHKIKDIVSDVGSVGDEKSVKVKLSEILSEEKRDLVVGLDLSKQSKAHPRKMTVVDIELSYNLLDKDGKIEKKTETFKGKVQFVKPGEEQEKPHQECDKVVALAQLVRKQIEAEELAKNGDYSGAQRVMEKFGGEVKRRGHYGYHNLAKKMKMRMGSSDRYHYSKAYFTSTKSAISRGIGTSGLSADAQHDLLTDANLSLDNAAQKKMTENFTSQDISTTLNLTKKPTNR